MSDSTPTPDPAQGSDEYRTGDGTGDPNAERPDTPPVQVADEAVAAHLEDGIDDRP